MDIETRIAKLDRLIDTITVATNRAMDRGDDRRTEALDRRYIVAEDAITASLRDYDDLMEEKSQEPDDVAAEAILPAPRQHADGVGFTPFAWRHMLHDTGFSADHSVRPFILGGTKPRVRIETRTTLTLAFQFYTGRPEVTHLWVQWSDGKRHLVHRKGC